MTSSRANELEALRRARLVEQQLTRLSAEVSKHAVVANDPQSAAKHRKQVPAALKKSRHDAQTALWSGGASATDDATPLYTKIMPVQRRKQLEAERMLLERTPHSGVEDPGVALHIGEREVGPEPSEPRRADEETGTEAKEAGAMPVHVVDAFKAMYGTDNAARVLFKALMGPDAIRDGRKGTLVESLVHYKKPELALTFQGQQHQSEEYPSMQDDLVQILLGRFPSLREENISSGVHLQLKQFKQGLEERRKPSHVDPKFNSGEGKSQPDGTSWESLGEVILCLESNVLAGEKISPALQSQLKQLKQLLEEQRIDTDEGISRPDDISWESSNIGEVIVFLENNVLNSSYIGDVILWLENQILGEEKTLLSMHNRLKQLKNRREEQRQVDSEFDPHGGISQPNNTIYNSSYIDELLICLENHVLREEKTSAAMYRRLDCIKQQLEEQQKQQLPSSQSKGEMSDTLDVAHLVDEEHLIADEYIQNDHGPSLSSCWPRYKRLICIWGSSIVIALVVVVTVAVLRAVDLVTPTHGPSISFASSDHMKGQTRNGSPNLFPSIQPSTTPATTEAPTWMPSEWPSVSAQPSSIPSESPSMSAAPSSKPSTSPSSTGVPSLQQSSGPSFSAAPTREPTRQPTLKPTKRPTEVPTLLPSIAPTISLSWVKRGEDLDGEAAGDWSGYSVALSSDGTVLAIGANGNDDAGDDAGHVRVYAWDAPAAAWVKRGEDLDGEAAGDSSGGSVALSSDGTVLAIGAHGNDSAGNDAGHVRVYLWDAPAAAWVKRGEDLDGEAAGDEWGFSMALSSNGTVIAVGARLNDGAGDGAGHVRVYEWDAPAAAWVKRGDDLDGEAAGDRSGRSVTLSSDGAVLAIGEHGNDGAGNDAGHVRAYAWDAPAAVWVRRGKDLNGEAARDWSGTSVALSSDGTVLAVGARGNDGAGGNAGHVRMYEWDAPAAAWFKRGEDLDGEAAGDRSGFSLALSSNGTVLAVGARYNDGAGNDAGHVRVYMWDAAAAAWIKRGDDLDGEADGDQSGWSVALSSDGTVLAVGAARNNATGYSAGHVRVHVWEAANKA